MLKFRAVCFLSAIALAKAASLTAPEKSLDSNFWDNSYKPLGTYQNGFFLFRDPDSGTVRVFDQQGSKGYRQEDSEHGYSRDTNQRHGAFYLRADSRICEYEYGTRDHLAQQNW